MATFARRLRAVSTFGLRQMPAARKPPSRHTKTPAPLASRKQRKPLRMPVARRGSGSCCVRGLRAAKAFRVTRRRVFVSRGLPGTEGWNGAAAFDEGRGTVRPNGGQWTASSTFRSKRRRAIPAAEPPGRPRGSWSREALFHWELATLALATFFSCSLGSWRYARSGQDSSRRRDAAATSISHHRQRMTHAIRSYSLITITYSLNQNGQAAQSTVMA